jgi:hypothetical protein
MILSILFFNSESVGSPLRQTGCKSRFTFSFFEAQKVNPLEVLCAKQDARADSLLMKKRESPIHCDLYSPIHFIHFSGKTGVKSESCDTSCVELMSYARRFTFHFENGPKVNLASYPTKEQSVTNLDSLFTRFTAFSLHPFASRRFTFAPITPVGVIGQTKVNRRRDGVDLTKTGPIPQPTRDRLVALNWMRTAGVAEAA